MQSGREPDRTPTTSYIGTSYAPSLLDSVAGTRRSDAGVHNIACHCSADSAPYSSPSRLNRYQFRTLWFTHLVLAAMDNYYFASEGRHQRLTSRFGPRDSHWCVQWDKLTTDMISYDFIGRSRRSSETSRPCSSDSMLLRWVIRYSLCRLPPSLVVGCCLHGVCKIARIHHRLTAG